MNKNRKLMYALDLQRFADVMNATTSATTGNDLSPEMKTFYDKNLIRLAEPYLVHDRFGQEKPIPRGNGKTIEFRKFSKLPKALTPLTEGVTPDGQALNVSAITATVNQYGGYVKITDMLQLTAIDPIITEATELIGQQAGRTLDTITREVLAGGTKLLASQAHRTLDTITREILVGGSNVAFANGKTARAAVAKTDVLTVKDIQKAVAALKAQDAPMLDGGYYAAIISPKVAYDLMRDTEWIDWQKHTSPEHMYNGEIGRIANVVFFESTEAKVFTADDLASDSATLAINGAVSANATTAVFDGGTVAANALAGRTILIDGKTYHVASNTASSGTATITLATGEKFAAISDNTVIYPGEAGAAGVDVYSTLIIGKNAYGKTAIQGGGLETIIKSKEQAGGPLNQYSTVGWKATKTAERLVEEYMIRIESGCSLD